MDQILSKAGSTLVTFAVRSGVQVASTYVIKSVSGLMAHVPESQKKQLERKRSQLEDKIETVMYSIEVVRLMAARGNSNLSNVLRLADYLKQDIDEFVKDIATLTGEFQNKNLSPEILKLLDKTIDDLVKKIDNIIPILNLVLTTYGTATINNFQDYVSPGRLLNSTVLVSKSNDKFTVLKEKKEVNVGPEFSLTFYNVFYNQNSEKQIIWREKYARCKFQLVRVPDKKLEYTYELRIKEDFNDERYHDDDEKPDCKVYDIRQISKLFFSASGKLLKLEDKSSPVLVLKTKKITIEELDEETLQGAKEKQHSDEIYEWIAVGDYEAGTEGESDEDETSEDEPETNTTVEEKAKEQANVKALGGGGSPLSLLEYLIRLCTLQANDQISVLEVKDERLRLYLADENYMNNATNKLAALTKKMENLKI